MKRLKQTIKMLTIIIGIIVFCAMSIIMIPLMIVVIVTFNNKKGKNFILIVGKYTGYEYLLEYLVDTFELEENDVF